MLEISVYAEALVVFTERLPYLLHLLPTLLSTNFLLVQFFQIDVY